MPFIARPAAGQIVDPAWGTLVADAVVMRFTTAAQRTSQLVAPVVGQLTSLDSAPGAVQYWTGTVWADTSGRTYTRVIDLLPGTAASTNTNNTYEIAPFAVARAGLAVAALTALFENHTLGAGGQQVTAYAVAGSVGPAPTTAPQGNLRDDQGFNVRPVPISASYTVTAGQQLAVKIRMDVGGGTYPLSMKRLYGTITVTDPM